MCDSFRSLRWTVSLSFLTSHTSTCYFWTQYWFRQRVMSFIYFELSLHSYWHSPKAVPFSALWTLNHNRPDHNIIRRGKCVCFVQPLTQNSHARSWKETAKHQRLPESIPPTRSSLVQTLQLGERLTQGGETALCPTISTFDLVSAEVTFAAQWTIASWAGHIANWMKNTFDLCTTDKRWIVSRE